MAKVLLPKDVNNPQSLRFVATDPVIGDARVVTIYTGLLNVGHFTGGDGGTIDIQFPLVGLFGTGTGTRAIFPLAPTLPLARQEFKGAVASASISVFVDKTDPSIVAIESATADLRLVTLNPNTPVHAVVLSARLKGQNSEFVNLAYHVTVLTLINSDFPIQAPVLVGGQFWDGTYKEIGNVEVPGVPQISL
jgi:hypothetical protein